MKVMLECILYFMDVQLHLPNKIKFYIFWVVARPLLRYVGWLPWCC